MRAVLFASLAALTLASAVAACKSSDAKPTGSASGSSGSGAGAGGAGTGGGPLVLPAWLPTAQILVSGETTTNMDCVNAVCPHSENTDLINWNGAIWLVHRTAESQILGPNSSLRISKSTDGGKTFQLQAVIAAPQPTYDGAGGGAKILGEVDAGLDGGADPSGRDIRDPHFYVVGDKLTIKTLCRLPLNTTRDSDIDTLPQTTQSTDGVHWSPLAPITDGMGTTWYTHSLWRIKQQNGVYYSAAYLDGDLSVTLFSSTDGLTWQKGADIYTVSANTPLETELTFMPSGKLLALVRTDGSDADLLGDDGNLHTQVCWADPPSYQSFTCPAAFDGQRLDGPLSFFHGSRLFVIARKHLTGLADKKRTSLFEITGNFDGGPLTIAEWGELPSAGDTSYAGIATIDADHSLVSWYSSNLQLDQPWWEAMFTITDIWTGTIDFTKLAGSPPATPTTEP